MASYYLWFKALHVAFMVTWFAGLFNLPRLFIYHAMDADPDNRAMYTLREQRLFAIMTIGSILTLVFGLIMVSINHGLLQVRWFQIKLLLLVGLTVYHFRCHTWIQRLRNSNEVQETRWLRFFNEIPALFLLAIVILAIVKPL